MTDKAIPVAAEPPVSSAFDQAIAAIRGGANYSLCGLSLTVNGITLGITGEQFDIAYDVMDEVDGDASVFALTQSALPTPASDLSSDLDGAA